MALQNRVCDCVCVGGVRVRQVHGHQSARHADLYIPPMLVPPWSTMLFNRVFSRLAALLLTAMEIVRQTNQPSGDDRV